MARLILLLVLCLAPAAAEAADRPATGPAPRTAVGASTARGDRGFWTRPRVQTAKAAVAAGGAALLLWGAALARAGRPRAQGWLRDALLVGLAASALLAWTEFLRFHHGHGGFAHPSEFFHYFVGARYFDELGYTRLYACAALADREAGALAAGGARPLRDLATNAVVSSDEVLAAPERCKRHFSPERWRAFRADVGWIRDRVAPGRWARMQLDHGFNATPVWTLVGRALAETGPISEARVRALGLIDPLLLAATAACVAWAFGWRALCVALLFWGTSHGSQFGWTGGAFLRQGWLAAAVIGLCLVRRGRPGAGGFLLATSALLRIFPGLLLAGLAAKLATDLLARRRLAFSSAQRRLLLGALLAPALLVPAAAFAGGGLRDWVAFAENSRVHLATPLVNHAGLRALLSYDPALSLRHTRDASLADPVARWKQGRRDTFERREPLFWLGVAGFAALLAWAARGADDWVALALGTGAIPIALELTSYYHAVLVVYALLWTRRPGVGVALCVLSAASWAIVDLAQWQDEIFAWISLATVVLVLYATVALGRATRRTVRDR